MLSESDLKVIDLAYTHARSVKKKTALEEVFLSLYSKYKTGDDISKIEYRTIKDYLAVYRSELASLKKKAKMKIKADILLDEKKAVEAKQAKEKQKADYEQALLDLQKYKDDLASLSNQLAKEKQQNIDLNNKLNSMEQNIKTNSSNRFLTNAYQRYISYDAFGSFNELTDVILTLFMIALGSISPKETDGFFDSFGNITTRNNKKCLRLSKKHKNNYVNLVFVHFTERLLMIGNSDKTDILAVVYITDENEYALAKASSIFVSLVTVNADVAQALLDNRLQNTKKPEIYSEIDYKNDSYRKVSSLLIQQDEDEEDYKLQIERQFGFENASFLAFRT